jgi:heme exporter protein C
VASVGDRAILALWTVCAPLMVGAHWMIFRYAPEERIMGAAQKIFYFHLPSAFVTYAAVAVLLAGSMAYLWTRDRRWDNLARSATESALVFCSLVLVTGPIWAKPAWGTWWTWEARLITTLVLWLLLVACLWVRAWADNRELGARLAAIVAIVAALDVPIIHKAVAWWRGQHPIVFGPSEDSGLAVEMQRALGVSSVTFFCLFGLLLMLRQRLASLEDRAADAAERLGAARGWD